MPSIWCNGSSGVGDKTSTSMASVLSRWFHCNAKLQKFLQSEKINLHKNNNIKIREGSFIDSSDRRARRMLQAAVPCCRMYNAVFPLHIILTILLRMYLPPFKTTLIKVIYIIQSIGIKTSIP